MSEPAKPSGSAIARRGLLLVLSSPSGAGKTTLSRELLKSHPDLRMSVSATTREPRPGEVEGSDYYFVDAAKFESMKAGGDLLEWAQVFGRSYGTPKAPVLSALADGRDMLFDIDWQGARLLKSHLPEDVVSVFILPPDGRTLERRLQARGHDSAEVMAQRMAAAAGEVAHWNEYDYVIVNAHVGDSCAALAAILTAERVKRTRQPGLESFVAEILREL